MELTEYLRFAIALIFVLALIGVLTALARRAGIGYPLKATRPGGGRRLSVVEVTPLDGRRRLVLVRRDDVEHLLLLGPSSELVIERNISSKHGFAQHVESIVRSDADDGGENK